eukprot:1157898-Pelagomonas_calceolata.AAC.7
MDEHSTELCTFWHTTDGKTLAFRHWTGKASSHRSKMLRLFMRIHPSARFITSKVCTCKCKLLVYKRKMHCHNLLKSLKIQVFCCVKLAAVHLQIDNDANP